jgi:hypothetical protein
MVPKEKNLTGNVVRNFPRRYQVFTVERLGSCCSHARPALDSGVSVGGCPFSEQGHATMIFFNVAPKAAP